MAEDPFEARLSTAKQQLDTLRNAIGRAVIGQHGVVAEVLWALIAGGHVLLEGAPGLGKTLLVRTLAECLELKYSRIQFTPDLMPSDVIGTRVLLLNAQHGAGRFELQRGPIFGQMVLADEINRATPKTQSALLEAMQEHAVTIFGERHASEQPFFVLATENPIEMEGTYPLPEAQLDRFLLKIVIASPSEDEMVRILEATTGRELQLPRAVLSQDDVLGLRALCRDIVVGEPVMRYAARLCAASAPDGSAASELVQRAIRYGAGVRGAQALVLAAKARALVEGRAHASFEDVQAVAPSVLRHRLMLSFEGEADGISTDAVIQDLVENTATRPERVERIAKDG